MHLKCGPLKKIEEIKSVWIERMREKERKRANELSREAKQSHLLRTRVDFTLFPSFSTLFLFFFTTKYIPFFSCLENQTECKIQSLYFSHLRLREYTC